MDRSARRKWLLISCGVLCVGLAAAGILLPVLPTTPFLLLAAACFGRSSARFYQWLISLRLFGPYIRNYREHGAISRRAKTLTLLVLWASIGYTTIFALHSLALRILLLLVAGGVTIHVLSLRTLTDEMISGQSAMEPVEESTAQDPAGPPERRAEHEA